VKLSPVIPEFDFAFVSQSHSAADLKSDSMPCFQVSTASDRQCWDRGQRNIRCAGHIEGDQQRPGERTQPLESTLSQGTTESHVAKESDGRTRQYPFLTSRTNYITNLRRSCPDSCDVDSPAHSHEAGDLYKHRDTTC